MRFIACPVKVAHKRVSLNLGQFAVVDAVDFAPQLLGIYPVQQSHASQAKLKSHMSQFAYIIYVEKDECLASIEKSLLHHLTNR